MDLGDVTLFLGDNHSVSVTASDHEKFYLQKSM